jgi:hypothetical protein
MELLQQSLLLTGGKAIEVGIAAENALLILDGLPAMLIEPVA